MEFGLDSGCLINHCSKPIRMHECINLNMKFHSQEGVTGHLTTCSFHNFHRTQMGSLMPNTSSMTQRSSTPHHKDCCPTPQSRPGTRGSAFQEEEEERGGGLPQGVWSTPGEEAGRPREERGREGKDQWGTARPSHQHLWEVGRQGEREGSQIDQAILF